MARLQVELDLLKNKPSQVWIGIGERGGFWQKVDYENVPSYCQHCWHVGHDEQSCRIHHPELVDQSRNAQQMKTKDKPKQVYVPKVLENTTPQVTSSSGENLKPKPSDHHIEKNGNLEPQSREEQPVSDRLLQIQPTVAHQSVSKPVGEAALVGHTHSPSGETTLECLNLVETPVPMAKETSSSNLVKEVQHERTQDACKNAQVELTHEIEVAEPTMEWSSDEQRGQSSDPHQHSIYHQELSPETQPSQQSQQKELSPGSTLNPNATAFLLSASKSLASTTAVSTEMVSPVASAPSPIAPNLGQVILEEFNSMSLSAPALLETREFPAKISQSQQLVPFRQPQIGMNFNYLMYGTSQASDVESHPPPLTDPLQPGRVLPQSWMQNTSNFETTYTEFSNEAEEATEDDDHNSMEDFLDRQSVRDDSYLEHRKSRQKSRDRDIVQWRRGRGRPSGSRNRTLVDIVRTMNIRSKTID